VSTPSLATTFAATGYVELTEAFPASLRRTVALHVAAALKAGGRRRDLRVSVTGDSPRRYRLAGRGAIEAAGSTIPELYRSPELPELLSKIVGAPVFRVPYVPEEYLATRLELPGDTHGWHWDDYALALVWVTAAPEESAGGALELIPEVPWNKEDPRIDHHLRTRKIHRRCPPEGAVYLLRADTTLHRVTPLRRAARREMCCLSFALEADLARAITHETLEQLTPEPSYAPPPPRPAPRRPE
jgi:hypothetical protein